MEVPFVWRKKTERDCVRFSVKAEKKKQKELMAELQNIKKRREEKAIKQAQHEEDKAMLARKRARAESQDWEKKEEDFFMNQNKLRYKILRAKQVDTSGKSIANAMGVSDEVEVDGSYGLRKPKYSNSVHTGYEWNKYNRIHYDHASPPPKKVQGYKFNVFYPDLVDEAKAPSYMVEKDGDSVDTCIIRFHAGPPYQDIVFRIVNEEWELSSKKGFKCVFENKVLRLYFNFKRHGYRR